jgi:hypothetical protein
MRAAFQLCELKSSARNVYGCAHHHSDSPGCAPGSGMSLLKTLTLPVVQLLVCAEGAGCPIHDGVWYPNRIVRGRLAQTDQSDHLQEVVNAYQRWAGFTACPFERTQPLHHASV